jgi:hypothetical protein
VLAAVPNSGFGSGSEPGPWQLVLPHEKPDSKEAEKLGDGELPWLRKKGNWFDGI